ncbi:tyrosine-type recombinase/integrase [Paracoccus salipaludis]|uniref:Integrase n=1 Tax=Paracoccus salipaludis TaxID=2032623 RepID=A0A2A2GGQ5_9RHOB|nr:tyrosine-type recombinase/integrase [Paracoccus salipaludis]PAU96691.1 integrase [Paracoccus salipaludis]
MSKRNPFPGATIVDDPRGGKRIRLRKTIKGRKIDCYLPGPWASRSMVEAYKAAITGTFEPPKSQHSRGTFDHTITDYLSSKSFCELRESTRYHKRLRLDWIREKIGAARLSDLQPYHVEHLMDLKGGPTAANRLHKELSEIYTYARKRLGFTGVSPTEQVDRRKIKSGGFHTWTDEQVAQFRDYHASGTDARMALELIIGTGAARQDARAMGRMNIKGGNIWYRRIKTGQDVELPLEYLPELVAELRQLPPTQATFILNRDGNPYTVESFGNWFADQCRDAGLPGECRAHGLRKYGATRLADQGASEFQIMAFLAHKTPQEARRYVQAANRVKLAAGALALLPGNNVQHLRPLDKAGA